MELKIEHGDYVPDGKGGFETVDGAEEVLQRALIRLTVPREEFFPLPDLGSRLGELFRQKPSDWEALGTQYVKEALEEERELSLVGVSFQALGDGVVGMTVDLLWQEEELTLEVTLQ